MSSKKMNKKKKKKKRVMGLRGKHKSLKGKQKE